MQEIGRCVLGICLAIVAAAHVAQAADPAPAAGVELTGWGEPAAADLAVLEELEGENLAEARKEKGTTLEIRGTKKDLDGDAIPELFFFVKHPMFCYEELGGCTILVVRRASLVDRWQEIGVLTAAEPSVVVSPARQGDFPALRPLGSQPYTWNGRQYEMQGGPAAAPAAETSKP
ncbi:MAG: hypothetical protein IT386_11765 [Deltaproteobacteria bacterium]|nr:hypothetical protein [Deltaproteobacteria bacterium]